jgi:hypothetical protein
MPHRASGFIFMCLTQTEAVILLLALEEQSSLSCWKFNVESHTRSLTFSFCTTTFPHCTAINQHMKSMVTRALQDCTPYTSICSKRAARGIRVKHYRRGKLQPRSLFGNDTSPDIDIEYPPCEPPAVVHVCSHALSLAPSLDARYPCSLLFSL